MIKRKGEGRGARYYVLKLDSKIAYRKTNTNGIIYRRSSRKRRGEGEARE